LEKQRQNILAAAEVKIFFDYPVNAGSDGGYRASGLFYVFIYVEPEAARAIKKKIKA
jgi:hypothetical protein